MIRVFNGGKVKIGEVNYFDSAIVNLETDVVKINDTVNKVGELKSRSDFNHHSLEQSVTYNSTYPPAIRDHNIYNYRIKRSFRASRLGNPVSEPVSECRAFPTLF